MAFGLDILDVAIGMVFLFLFMSMIASALREALEALLQQRAGFLEKGIIEMLRTGEAQTWVKEFYEHPVISSLYQGIYKKDAKLPAYIPKESFSLAVLDLAAKASENGKLLSIEDLKSKLIVAQPAADQASNPPPNEVQRIILTALSVADNDLESVRKQVEAWYDAAMTRVSGWYAKRTGMFLFVIGFGAAVALNVDSIAITKSLIVDRSLRQAVVGEAESYVKQSPDAGQPAKSFNDLRTAFDEIGYPIGWATYQNWLYPAPQACRRAAAKTGDGVVDFVCDGNNLPYPAIWLLALLGWLITAIAVMLGAPFWFQLLNKLVSLRSTLKPPEKTTPLKDAGTNSDTGDSAKQPAPVNPA